MFKEFFGKNMDKVKSTENYEALVKILKADLMGKYGPLLTGDALREALGYRSMAAMQQAVLRRTLTIPIFTIQHRRGKFALAEDIAYWLAEQRKNH